jgi:rhodanese-related sulfurtransferase
MRHNIWIKGFLLFISAIIVLPISGAVTGTYNDIQTCNDLSYCLNGAGYTNITVWDAWNMTHSSLDGNQIPIDVRRNDEWIPEHIDTPFPEYTQHWPNLQNGDNLTKFMKEFQGQQVIIYCRTGVRSFNAVKLLLDSGFTGTIYNMIGGITEWKKQSLPVKPNEAPNKPTITGPSTGKVGIPVTYTFTTSDTDYDEIEYCIKWDNASNEDCVGPFSELEPGSATHTYLQQGSYTIRVTAKDRYNFISEEAIEQIPMPQHRQLPQFLDLFLERFPNTFPLLRHLMGY